MIVRWGIDALPEVVPGAFLQVSTERWPDYGAAARWTEVPSARIDDAAALARDCVVAVGGGSAIDLGKAISAAAHVPLVVPAELVQLIPGGAEVTDPVPLPAPCTVSINCCCPNVALTLRAWSIVTMHERELAQVIPEPFQPLNTAPAAAVAVRVTDVPPV